MGEGALSRGEGARRSAAQRALKWGAACCPVAPTFTPETAAHKVRLAEDAWKTRDPGRVSLAYTEGSRWRNRSEFLQGRPAIVEFLTRKWELEQDYRLSKELWVCTSDQIAVRFQ